MYLQLLSTLNFTKDQLSPTAQFLGMKNETAFTAITGLTYWEDGQRRNVLTAFPQGISNLKKRKNNNTVTGDGTIERHKERLAG